MKKLAVPAAAMISMFILSSCSGTGGSDATVRIHTGLSGNKSSRATASLQDLQYIKIYASAGDMSETSRTFSTVSDTATISVPAGKNRTITVAAFDDYRATYAGSATVDLTAGTTTDINITMQETLGMVADINEGTDYSSPNNLTAINGKLYFQAATSAYGTEPYVYDGTGEPQMIANIAEESDPPVAIFNSDPSGFILFNDKIYFSAQDSSENYGLYSYDGKTVELVSDTETFSSPLTAITVWEGNLVFAADDSENTPTVWQYTGTKITNISYTITFDSIQFMTVYNDLLVFATYYYDSDTYSFIYHLYSYDGSELLQLDNDDQLDTWDPVVFNNILYFTATDTGSISGSEIWSWDGTNTPALAYDLWSGSDSSNPENLTVFKNRMYFSAIDNSAQTELWSLDGSSDPSAIELVTAGNSSPTGFTKGADTLFFNANTETGRGLYYYNPGRDVTPVPATDEPYDNMTAVSDSVVLMGGDDGGLLRVVYLEDVMESGGTAAPVFLDINNDGGSTNTDPGNFVKIGNKIYFSACTDTHGEELWVYEHYE